MECLAILAPPTRFSARLLFSAILDHPEIAFVSLFLFRYLRFIVHLVSYFCYRPSPVPESPWLTEQDCTVVIPTCAPEDPAFSRCVESIVKAAPRVIHIVPVGREQETHVWTTISHLVSRFPNIHFKVSPSSRANKRAQVAEAIKSIKTSITVLCDDHVTWPSSRFLLASLAPFEEDPGCGGVGTRKVVIRRPDIGLWQGFWNVMGALYLERHNFEHTASNTVDGGVAVISGRTCLYRTRILQDETFLSGYLNEMFFFGQFGPLNADDDNYITRHLVKQGWRIKFQNKADATILCEVGEYPKFLQQCLRWARTTFRSNTCSLITDRSIYKAQPWTVYALMIGQMVNFALIWDPLLILSLTRTNFYSKTRLVFLCVWIVFSKIPKLVPYFWRNPSDLGYLPTYYLFAYFHSFLKLWAMLTVWDVAWSGRTLENIGPAASVETDDTQSGDEIYDIDDIDDALPQSSVPRTPRRRSRSPRRSAHFAFVPTPPPTTTSSHRREDSRTRPTPISTPWGFVSPVNLTSTPANTLQSHLSGRSWPANFSMRKRNVYQAQEYADADEEHSLPRVGL